MLPLLLPPIPSFVPLSGIQPETVWTLYGCLCLSFVPLKSDRREGVAQLTGGDEKKQDDRGENINMEYVE